MDNLEPTKVSTVPVILLTHSATPLLSAETSLPFVVLSVVSTNYNNNNNNNNNNNHQIFQLGKVA